MLPLFGTLSMLSNDFHCRFTISSFPHPCPDYVAGTCAIYFCSHVKLSLYLSRPESKSIHLPRGTFRCYVSPLYLTWQQKAMTVFYAESRRYYPYLSWELLSHNTKKINYWKTIRIFQIPSNTLILFLMPKCIITDRRNFITPFIDTINHHKKGFIAVNSKMYIFTKAFI